MFERFLKKIQFFYKGKQFLKIVLFGLILFFPGCGSNSPKNKASEKRISLQENLRLSVIPLKDETQVQNLENWPEQFINENPMEKLGDELQKEFTNRVGLYSPTKKIEIVHQSERPNYRIQLEFLELKFLDSGLELKGEVHVFDQLSASGDFSLPFSVKGKAQFDAASKKDFYNWGKAFDKIRKSFPHQDLLSKLFFSPTNKGTI